jgi:hypothetical protein
MNIGGWWVVVRVLRGGGGVEGGKKRLRPNDINVIRWRYRWANGRCMDIGGTCEGGG